MQEVNVLSLGAGTQSSALLLKMEYGEIERPEFAVFADTGAETRAVYKWLEYLRSLTTIPIVQCQKGNIEEDHLDQEGTRFASAPFFIKSKTDQPLWSDETDSEGNPIVAAYKSTEQQGMGQRQCTREYKIDPIYQAVRERLGYKKRQVVKEHQVNMFIGISIDEVTRMKPSLLNWVTNKYPLIERKISRPMCEEYVLEKTGKLPPRSACYFCPYRSNREWRHMKEFEPLEWDRAVNFDKKIRTLPKFNNKNYVHRDMVPLDEAYLAEDQIDMFENECEGMCGV